MCTFDVQFQFGFKFYPSQPRSFHSNKASKCFRNSSATVYEGHHRSFIGSEPSHPDTYLFPCALGVMYVLPRPWVG